MEQDTLFINRELSWLEFNRRVLALSKDKEVPLAEQLKFAAIYGSNLDEFFMVRVGSLQDQLVLDGDKADAGSRNASAAQQLNAIMPVVAELQGLCDKYVGQLEENLRQKGYNKLNFDKLTKEQERFWKKYFEAELFPLLSPQIIDHRHPFPFLRNQEIYLGVTLKNKGDSEISFGIIPVSSQFERVLYLQQNGVTWYALVEELIAHYAPMAFGRWSVQKKCLFRVTRNADITPDEGLMDQDIDYREIMTELLKKRRKLAPVRIQFWPEAPQEIQHFLCQKLILSGKRCFVQQSPLDLSCLFRLASRLASDGHTELCYPAARPMQAPADYNLEEQVQHKDVLLCYPYQSMRPFIKMLKKAAYDPDVLSIKMTLYRVARDSQIVQALVAAAENGNAVVTVVELRARFDEQNNIDWSKQLEQAGCTVIYGFDNYKVHSKLTLITRKKNGKFQYISQIGTGNYNEKTSEQYTDLSFVTSNQEIGEEVAAVFNNLAVERLTPQVENLLVAPLCFKSVLMQEMDREIQAARNGHPARILLKNNSINDKDIILKLSEASCAGVPVDMIVRGICCVKAGVPGLTENLRVRSFVGRYLEHSRIYAFGVGEDVRVYIASGDFLTRNTQRRVEVGVRVRQPDLVARLLEILRLELEDNVNAREMRPNGKYVRVKPADGQARIDSQMLLYDLFREDFHTAPPAAAAPKRIGILDRLRKIFQG